jgi:hypothetical protein
LPLRLGVAIAAQEYGDGIGDPAKPALEDAPAE